MLGLGLVASLAVVYIVKYQMKLCNDFREFIWINLGFIQIRAQVTTLIQPCNGLQMLTQEWYMPYILTCSSM